MSNHKSTLKALGAQEPLDSMNEPQNVHEAAARKERLVDRMMALDAQFSLPDGGTGSWQIWRDLRPQLVAEKQRLMMTLRMVNKAIAKFAQAQKLTEWDAIRALLAIVDRLQESGVKLTEEESTAVDEAAYLIDVAEEAGRR